jgi:hypothetical protein
MTVGDAAPWRTMVFTSPEGRQEALWVEELDRNRFRVLSVPVWAYGISVGTVVDATDVSQSELSFGAVLRESHGGTVRVLFPSGTTASTAYLERLLPEAESRQLHIGPSTFFDPRVVAINLHRRDSWWPRVGTWLEELKKAGVIEQWEVADPDEYAAEHGGGSVASTGSGRQPLVHPLPVSGSRGEHLS